MNSVRSTVSLFFPPAELRCKVWMSRLVQRYDAKNKLFPSEWPTNMCSGAFLQRKQHTVDRFFNWPKVKSAVSDAGAKEKKTPSAFKQHHHIHRRSLCFDEFPAAGWLLFPGLASDKSLCPSTLAAIVIRQHIHNVCWSSCSALAKRPARARYSLNVWAEGSRGAWEVKIKKTCAWGSRAKECRLSFIPYLLRDPGLEHMHARPKSNRRMVMYNFEVAYTVKAFLRGLCCGMQIRDVKDLNCVPNIYKNTIEILWHGYENIADSLLNVRLRRHSKTYTACHPLYFNRLTVKDAIGLSFFFFISLLLSALTTDRHTLPCSLPPARLRTK